jgi:DNA-binding PadR family transcriptional regulator
LQHEEPENLVQPTSDHHHEHDSDSDAGRRSRKPKTRGGRSNEHRTRGDKPEADSDGRRGRRSESRSERSEERHSHREGRGHGHHRSRSRGRAQRGDVRAAVLVLLAEQPMHGYQLMHAIADRTEGAWRPSPGAIYPTIAQLEDEDLVSIVADAGRKLVTLTESGREYLSAHQDTLGDPFTAITSEAGGRNDLRGSVDQVYAAARTVGESGTDAQIASAQQVLNQAKRSLYLILAEEPAEALDSDVSDA